MQSARLFDRDLLKARFRRFAASGAGSAPDAPDRRAGEEIIARLSATNRRFGRALVCARSPDWLAERIRALGKTQEILTAAPLARPPGGKAGLALDLDAADLPLPPESLGLFVSVFGLAFVNDLPGALERIRRLLRPDGLFIAAIPGAQTLRELRAAWAMADTELDGEPALRVAPFCDIRQAGDLLRLAGFALPVADREMLDIRRRGALALMREIRRAGWANPLTGRPRRPVTKARLARAAGAYEAAFSEADGRVRATFELIYLAGWAPHESQQQPLAPGAACTPLSIALPDRRG